MAGYLARRVLDRVNENNKAGALKFYKIIFSYKGYLPFKEETDSILVLEGHEDLVQELNAELNK